MTRITTIKCPSLGARPGFSGEVRLGKINLLLVWVIAVATVTYTVAMWLQFR